MRIVIDARTGDGTGISRYSSNLITELEKLPSDYEFIVLLGEREFKQWKPANKRFTKMLSPYGHYSFGEQLGLVKQLRELKPDLVHFTSFNAPLFYRGKRVITIHDLILVHFKNVRNELLHKLFYPIKYWVMRMVMRKSVLGASAIITPTEFVKHDILATWGSDALGRVRPQKITVTPLAVEHATIKRKARPLQSPYLLYVGAAYPHKNLGVLIDAFEITKRTQPNLKLVIIGKKDYWQGLIRAKAAQDSSVIFPGYVSNDELAAYYEHAAAFVFPSLAEGFGLPPLEAMAYDAPVISSDASAIPETCGKAALYFDGRDAHQLANRITELLGDQTLADKLRLAGREQVKRFSWKTMATETLTVYDNLLK